jgi:hypothetical protein
MIPMDMKSKFGMRNFWKGLINSILIFTTFPLFLVAVNSTQSKSFNFTKKNTMDKTEKLHLMEKILRELDDVVNSQTSLLKKVAQLEAENINLGNTLLEKQLPEIHSKADDALIATTALQTEFTEAKDKFIKDNKLDEVLPEAS